MANQHIIDNQANTVAAHLQKHLSGADSFSLVSAYFTIYGYELLEEALAKVGNVRFLFGDPASVEGLDPGDSKSKSFVLTEDGLMPKYVLEQKHLAQRCAAWVSSDAVAIRSASQSNFLHGKLYLTAADEGDRSAVVGSSNFTKRGLGGSDHAPESVYYKTLYELFRKDIDARLAGDDSLVATGFTDSQIWNALYEFQKDGAKSVIAKLLAHNGCILADSVGLGKTYTALAVVRYFEQRNERVLVLCPRKLRDNWSLY